MAGVKRSLGAMLGQDARPGVIQYSRDQDPMFASEGSRTRHILETISTSTNGTSSPTSSPLTGDIPNFSSNATLVLVGIRGAGKTTLAIIASSAMKRRVIDMETTFQRTTGLSSSGYKQNHGIHQCHNQQFKILREVLDQNKTDSIIVCSWMDSGVQSLLRGFSSTHPVVHVVRDPDAIQRHLKIQDHAKLSDLLKVSHSIFRTCANFEFFNITEISVFASPSLPFDTAINRLPAPYLTLKQAERHLLKYLSLIYPKGAIPFTETAFPLATVSVDELPFTYALSVQLIDLLKPGFDIEEHVAGADAIQLIIDSTAATSSHTTSCNQSFNVSNDLTRAVGIIRRSTVLPIIAHILLPTAANDIQVRTYLELISHAICLAPDFITISLRLEDADISRISASKGRSKIIGDYYEIRSDVKWDDPTWISLYKKASRLGCHMIRLVREAKYMEDNFSINRLWFAVEALDCRKIPLTAFNSGTIGRHSACLNSILTPVASPMGNEKFNHSHRPCITAQEATGALSSSFLINAMKLYVFGVKVDYSLSPAMHNAAFAACNLPHRYEPHSADSLSSIRHLIEDPNFGGASIGLPFKVEIISLTHSLSHHARAIGAVNTLIPIRSMSKDGSVPEGADFFKSVGKSGAVVALYGENTDWIGIRACIRNGLSPANAVRPATCGVIIGAGGMARAAVYAMLQVGVQNIVIWNRTKANAENMVAHFTRLLLNPDFQSLGAGRETKFHILQSSTESWPTAFTLPTIIISCIPTHAIGDVPAPDFVVPEDWLASRTGGVIIELGYKTLHTPLLFQARREATRGWVAMDGLDLLPEQGFAQFELFTGRRAPRRVMRRDLMKAHAEAERQSARGSKSRQQSEISE